MEEQRKQELESLFCPYEQSLALKELGFDEPCFGTWDRPDKLWIGNPVNGVLDIPEDIILAPTYSQAFRFFREKYGLYSVIDGLENRQYYKITQLNTYSKEYDTYEQAKLECIRKLIELANEKKIHR
jgi:hypothetical protein